MRASEGERGYGRTVAGVLVSAGGGMEVGGGVVKWAVVRCRDSGPYDGEESLMDLLNDLPEMSAPPTPATTSRPGGRSTGASSSTTSLADDHLPSPFWLPPMELALDLQKLVNEKLCTTCTLNKEAGCNLEDGLSRLFTNIATEAAI